jgi:WD40 repeat protein
VDTGECLQVFRGHFNQIYAVAFDGKIVASGGLDTTVRVWDAHTGYVGRIRPSELRPSLIPTWQTLYRDASGSHRIGMLAAIDIAHTRDGWGGWSRTGVLTA